MYNAPLKMVGSKWIHLVHKRDWKVAEALLVLKYLKLSIV